MEPSYFAEDPKIGASSSSFGPTIEAEMSPDFAEAQEATPNGQNQDYIDIEEEYSSDH
ncbi:uncharacterized protein VTP21DRAFT_1106, partial [Calcarisporiella thermophila]|uniref:uncharacterized protein n=1 Tax=Calcarisporiella thermophila TaxID=911321 RepID=UPI0037444174